MSSAQYDEDWQLSTGMGSELCILSSRMQNACSKKVYDTVHEYCVILGSMQTYQAVFGNTEPNMHNAFHKIFPSFIYQATTPGPKSSRNTLGCHCTAWSRISMGNASVKTIGATVPICYRWTFPESAINELLEIVSNASSALAFFSTWYVNIFLLAGLFWSGFDSPLKITTG